MARQAVMDSFAAAVAAVNPLVPVIDVEAASPDINSLPAIWQMIRFTGSRDEAVCLGSPGIRRESGTVSVAVFGDMVNAGGDGPIRVHAEAVHAALRRFTDAAIQLSVGSSTMPENESQQSDGRHFGLVTSFEYIADYTG